MSNNEEILRLRVEDRGFKNAISDAILSLDKFGVATKIQPALDEMGNSFAKVRQRISEMIPDSVKTGFEQFKYALQDTVSVAQSLITLAVADWALRVGRSLFEVVTGIDSMRTGFAEYELQMRSIQTILANTAKHGTSLEQVTAALDELNNYADKTIYNFTQMTTAVGMFTTAGMKANDATQAIKGLYNVAALSGAGPEAVERASYQMSQALAAGEIRLMDWRSMINANIANDTFKDALIRNANAMGVQVEVTKKGTKETKQYITAMDKWGNTSTKEIKKTEQVAAKMGSVSDLMATGIKFNESLEKGWLTSDVMMQTLREFAGEVSDLEFKKLGFSDKQIAQIKKTQKSMEESATKTRTLSQLMSTYQEIVGSGWSKTMAQIFGNFEEATDLFSRWGNAATGWANRTADAREKVFASWKKAGGRDDLIRGVENIARAVLSVANAWSAAYKRLNNGDLGKGLATASKAFADITTKLVPSNAGFERMVSIFTIVLKTVKMVVVVLVALGKAIFSVAKYVVGIVWDAFQGLLSIISPLAGETKNLSDVFGILGAAGAFIAKTFQKVFSLFDKGLRALGSQIAKLGTVVRAVVQFGRNINDALKAHKTLQAFGKAIKSVATQIWDLIQKIDLRKMLSPLGETGDKIASVFEKIGDAMKRLFGGAAGGVKFAFSAEGIDQAVESITNWLTKVGESDSVTKTFLETTKRLSNVVGNIKDVFQKAADNVEGFLKVGNSAESEGKNILFRFIDGFKKTIDKIKADPKLGDKLTAAVFGSALVIMFLSLKKSLAKVEEVLKPITEIKTSIIGAVKDIKGAIMEKIKTDAFMSVAIAIGVLAGAMILLAKLPKDQFEQGVLAIAVLGYTLKTLVGVIDGGDWKNMAAGAASLVVMTAALMTLIAGVVLLGSMDSEKMFGGLTAVLALLGALTGVILLLGRYAKALPAMSVGLATMAASVGSLAVAVALLAAFPTGKVLGATAAISSLVLAVATASMIMSNGGGGSKSKAKVSAKDNVSGAASLVVMATALLMIAGALKVISTIDVKQMLAAVTALGLIVTGMTAAAKSLQDNAGAVALVIAAAAIVAISGALLMLSEVPFDVLMQSVAGIGIVLAALVIALYGMESAAAGAVSLVIAAGAVLLLTAALTQFSDISWGDILKAAGAIVILGAALIVVTGAMGLLSEILILGAGVLIAIGVGILAVGVGMLALGQGLKLISENGKGSAEGLQTFISIFPDLITAIAESLAILIGAVVTTIVEASVKIGEGLLVLIGMLIVWVYEHREDIKNLVVALIDIVVEAVLSAAVKLADAFLRLLDSVVSALDAHLPGLITKLVQLLTTMIDLISEQGPIWLEHASNALITFMNDLADVIDKKSPEIGAAGRRLAKSILDGIVEGLSFSYINDAINTKVASVKDGVIGAFDNVFEINSPSRVLRRWAPQINEGVALGISDSAGSPQQAARKVGEGIISAMEEALRDTEDIANGSDLTPVITPVVDLSQVKKGLSAIPSNATLDVSTTMDSAVAVSNDSQNGSGFQSGNTTEVTYNQTINSPKPISTAEVYRNTRSQLSRIKKGF